MEGARRLCEWRTEDDILGGEECQRGVAIMVDAKVAKRITEVQQCSDRPIMVKVSAMPVDMVIICPPQIMKMMK